MILMRLFLTIEIALLIMWRMKTTEEINLTIPESWAIQSEIWTNLKCVLEIRHKFSAVEFRNLTELPLSTWTGHKNLILGVKQYS